MCNVDCLTNGNQRYFKYGGYMLVRVYDTSHTGYVEVELEGITDDITQAWRRFQEENLT